MDEEYLFDPTFGGSLPLPDDTRAEEWMGYATPDEIVDYARQSAGVDDYDFGAYDITSPENYPISLDNKQGYILENSLSNYLSQFGGGVKDLLTALQGKSTIPGGKQGTDYLKYILALLAARQAIKDRPRTITTGGGTTQAYQGPKSLQRSVGIGPTGQPIMKYAAEGGVMHAYRNGGQVRPFPMQDGGFVLTKRAVDGAGGPQGLASLVPEARMIRGPGHGTSDSIPAYIQGPNGRTPARVSNGEAYVPPGYDPRQLQATMKRLERKA